MMGFSLELRIGVLGIAWSAVLLLGKFEQTVELSAVLGGELPAVFDQTVRIVVAQ